MSYKAAFALQFFVVVGAVVQAWRAALRDSNWFDLAMALAFTLLCLFIEHALSKKFE